MLKEYEQRQKNNEYFKKFSIGCINEMKKDVYIIYDLLKGIENSIANFQKNSNKLNLAIEECDKYLNEMDLGKTIRKDLIQKIGNALDHYNDSIMDICYKYFEQFKETYKNISNKYNELINFDFFPKDNYLSLLIDSSGKSTDNSNSNSGNQSFQSENKTKSFFKEMNEEKNEENENKNLCFNCKKAPNIYIKKSNICYCEECFSIFYDENPNFDIDKEAIILEKMIPKKEKNKNAFLNSIEIIIKNILYNSNFILNNEVISSKNINDKTSMINIGKVINYPTVVKDNIQTYLNFITEINMIFKKEFTINNKNNKAFVIDNQELIDLLKNNVFIDEKTKSIAYEISIVDSGLNLYSDNEKINDDEDIEDEKFVIKDNFLTNFYFQIILISKKIKNLNFEEIKHIQEKVVDKINASLSINKDNFLVTLNDENKNIFIDDFVRTEKFSKLPLQEIKNYTNLKELYEFKIIIQDLLKNQCNLKDFLDFKGNFYNTSNKFHKIEDKENIKNNWIGVGINVLGKYDNGTNDWLNKNSEWITAYYGVGGKLPSNKVKEQLFNTIKNGINQGNSQKKCNFDDKRHPGKKVGAGVYLTPNINFLENYAGTVFFNNQKYKVALMTKVNIQHIREPKDINYIWVLPKKYIRAYRILLKKIK